MTFKLVRPLKIYKYKRYFSIKPLIFGEYVSCLMWV